MDTPARLMLSDFCDRAGLEAPDFEPEAYMGLVIDERLISIDFPGPMTIKLFATMALPEGREAEALADGVAHNETMNGANGPIVSLEEDGEVLVVHQTIDVQGMHLNEFERKVTAFDELCERLCAPRTPESEQTPPPVNAIYG